MAFALGPKALSAGYRLAVYQTIGSTNAEARARAERGEDRLWVVAREQTAGYGRRGRAWQTPPGNLAASLLIRLGRSDSRTATLGFVAGLALEKSIREAASAKVSVFVDGAEGRDARLRLKWPNDLLVGGAKVAGILLEAISSGSRSAVVVGIGVNVLYAPEGLPYPTTSLAACGTSVTAETLFHALSDAWIEQEAAWRGGQGFAEVRRAWLDRAAGVGGPVAVRSGSDVFRGTFETIDEDGRLIVRSSDGVAQAVSAGEVHFGAVATAQP